MLTVKSNASPPADAVVGITLMMNCVLPPPVTGVLGSVVTVTVVTLVPAVTLTSGVPVRFKSLPPLFSMV
ncbi:MAG: hypothetical protein ICCCNLDF_00886 [Planctomycetes bacterium]|nr:hypothetical protein [Planctomycetota bacterium]